MRWLRPLNVGLRRVRLQARDDLRSHGLGQQRWYGVADLALDLLIDEPVAIRKRLKPGRLSRG